MSRSLPEFEQLYAGQQLIEGFQQIPWNIGEPQPPIAGLIDAGEVRGDVLDAGCGVGETSLYLAARGFSVLGVDSSPSAIRQARRSAEARGVPAEFEVADVTELAGHEGRFGTVIDSTLFHSLPVEARQPYLAAAARAAAPGAVLHVLVFSRGVTFAEAPEGTAPEAAPEAGGGPEAHGTERPSGPNAVDEEELRAVVSTHWTVDSVVDSHITAILPEERARHTERDERGRSLIPAYLLRAHRSS